MATDHQRSAAPDQNTTAPRTKGHTAPPDSDRPGAHRGKRSASTIAPVRVTASTACVPRSVRAPRVRSVRSCSRTSRAASVAAETDAKVCAPESRKTNGSMSHPPRTRTVRCAGTAWRLPAASVSAAVSV